MLYNTFKARISDLSSTTLLYVESYITSIFHCCVSVWLFLPSLLSRRSAGVPSMLFVLISLLTQWHYDILGFFLSLSSGWILKCICMIKVLDKNKRQLLIPIGDKTVCYSNCLSLTRLTSKSPISDPMPKLHFSPTNSTSTQTHTHTHSVLHIHTHATKDSNHVSSSDVI